MANELTIAAGEFTQLQPLFEALNLTEVYFRRYLDQTFVSGDGVVRLKGDRSSIEEHGLFEGGETCTVDAGGTIHFPSFTTPVTTNGVPDDSTYTYAIYDEAGNEIAVIARDLRVPEVLSPPTLQNLLIYNASDEPSVPDTTYTKAEVNALLAQILDGAVKSNVGILGISKSSKGPLVLGDPVHVETSESLFAEGIKTYYYADLIGANFGAKIDALVALAAGANVRLKITDTVTATTKVVPATIQIVRDGRGLINVPNGVTLTVNNMEDCGKVQFFNVSVGGAVYFGKGALPSLRTGLFTSSTDIEAALEQILASIDNTTGGRIKFPIGSVSTAGLHPVPSGAIIEGSGAITDGPFLGTNILAIDGNPLFLVGENKRNMSFSNLRLDGDELPGSIGILCEGAGQNPSFGVKVKDVVFRGLDIGFDIHSVSGGWQCGQVRIETPQFINCETGYRGNTNNTALQMDSPYFLECETAFQFDGAGISTIIAHDIGATAAVTPNAKGYVVDGDHLAINIIGGQDEGLETFLEVNVGQITDPINLLGNLIQAFVRLNASCLINVYGNRMYAEVFLDAPGVAAIVNIHGCSFRRHLDSENLALTPIFDGLITESVSFGDAVSRTFTVNPTTDVFTLPNFGAHLQTGSRLQATTTGVLPAGMFPETDYWFIRLSTTTGKLAASFADCVAGVGIPIVNAGSGTHSLTLPAARFDKFVGDSYINEVGNIASRTDRVGNYTRFASPALFAGNLTKPQVQIESSEDNQSLLGWAKTDAVGAILKSYRTVIDGATFNLKFIGDDASKGYEFDSEVICEELQVNHNAVISEDCTVGGSLNANSVAASTFGIDKTVTASGTTGAQAINKQAGRVNFAAAATSLVVTNSLITANSIIVATVMSNDATMKTVSVVAAAGSFTIYANAAPTAETKVAFWVL